MFLPPAPSTEGRATPFHRFRPQSPIPSSGSAPSRPSAGCSPAPFLPVPASPSFYRGRMARARRRWRRRATTACHLPENMEVDTAQLQEQGAVESKQWRRGGKLLLQLPREQLKSSPQPRNDTKYKNLDLKSFFSSNFSSSSGSGPSTRESGNNIVSEQGEVVVQGEREEPGETTRAGLGNAEHEEEQVSVHQPPPPQDAEGIKVFDPDAHVVSDPGLRLSIEEFHPNIRDDEPSDEKFGHDAFTKVGYRHWKNAYHGLPLHVGGTNSCHNRARAASDDFKNARASVEHKCETYDQDAEKKYEVRVTAAFDIANFLIAQAHAFRGHDEYEGSLNKGNFLEMIEWYKKTKEEVREAFEVLCPDNARMTSHKIQKDLCRSYAKEIAEVIKHEIGDKCFSVLIDESRDVSIAEQMAVIVRFVNDKGMVVERFLGLQHVPDTTSNALKKALLQMLSRYGLVVARLRGQGYDGASNMRGQFNGLQKQIRDENPYAFYVHCFAHQLQLVIVAVTSCCSSFSDFFTYVGLIVTSASSSCQRKDKLIAKHRDSTLSKLVSGEIVSGKGKHQSTTLVRPGDTRWGSHYITLLRIESMWDSVIKVLSGIHEDERNPGRAAGLVRKMECFDFVLNMKFMLKVLRITNELSLLLQRKDQNIVEAMSLLVDVKTRLMNFRNEGWQPLFEEAKSFCDAKKIPMPNMNEEVPRWGRSRLDGNLITLEHHYRVDTFIVALDSIITEMDHRFNEVSSELLVCFSCLDPRDSFSRFDIDKLARLTEIYDKDFSDDDRSYIRDQLELFLVHVSRVDDFV
ncbi:hypothetical protein EJB05_12821, partial [Eragrostis curvula]